MVFCAASPKQGKQQKAAWQHQSFCILHLHATDGSPATETATATATATAAKREIRHTLAAGTVLSFNAALAALLSRVDWGVTGNHGDAFPL